MYIYHILLHEYKIHVNFVANGSNVKVTEVKNKLFYTETICHDMNGLLESKTHIIFCGQCVNGGTTQNIGIHTTLLFPFCIFYVEVFRLEHNLRYSFTLLKLAR